MLGDQSEVRGVILAREANVQEQVQVPELWVVDKVKINPQGKVRDLHLLNSTNTSDVVGSAEVDNYHYYDNEAQMRAALVAAHPDFEEYLGPIVW